MTATISNAARGDDRLEPKRATREEWIKALEEVVAWLRDHPEVPPPYEGTLAWNLANEGWPATMSVAAAFTGDVTLDRSTGERGTHITYIARVGPVELRAYKTLEAV